MKRGITGLICLSLILTFGGCFFESSSKKVEPDISQVKAICELSTMDCYYHNVAKYYEEDASGFWIFKKDKEFWIEYSGVVTIGIDASLVGIEINDSKVTVTLPPAKVLGSRVDETSLNKESFIVAEGSSKPKAEDATKVYAEAQNKMVEAANGNKTLLSNAQENAKILIENYINRIGEAMDIEYEVNWEYIGSDNDENNNSNDNTGTEESYS